MYTDVHEAVDRLVGTVVRFNEEPVYVHRIEEDSQVHHSPLDNLDVITKACLTNPLWNFKSPQLGYVNIKDEAIFVTRVPQRRYKQGIDVRSIRGVKDSSGYIRRLDQSTILESLMAPIKNIYPPIEKCMGAMKRTLDYHKRGREDLIKMKSIAFRRDMALAVKDTSSIILEYKGDSIGLINSDTFNIFLKENKQYLKEFLTRKGFILT